MGDGGPDTLGGTDSACGTAACSAMMSLSIGKHAMYLRGIPKDRSAKRDSGDLSSKPFLEPQPDSLIQAADLWCGFWYHEVFAQVRFQLQLVDSQV